ncbi:MAG: calcium/sodium antiporter [archaeon]
MVMVYVLFIVGLFLLVKGANWVVDSASSIAKLLGVSSLVIGLTVVAFGTTLPELVVNLFAAFAGSNEVIFGNVIGSYIANILLVLGIIIMIGRVRIARETVWEEIPFAFLAVFVLFVLTGNLINGGKEFLTRNDGLILLSLFFIFLYYIFQMTKDKRKSFDVSMIVDRKAWKIVSKLVAGVVGIYFGGKWVVNGAVSIAELWGMSEYLISATIIAVGTSLPELVVGIVAVIKKNADLAVGNIIGANVLNICWVLGVVPLIAPLAIPTYIGFDIGVMFLATLLLFIFVFVGKKGELSKTEGIVFLLFYGLYLWFVIWRG